MCCKENVLEGRFLPIPNKPLYQRFICNNCIISGKAAIVKYALKINALTAAQVESLAPTLTSHRANVFDAP
jgi:hypothetical protein